MPPNTLYGPNDNYDPTRQFPFLFQHIMKKVTLPNSIIKKKLINLWGKWKAKEEEVMHVE